MARIRVTFTQMSEAMQLISKGVVQAVLVDKRESESGNLQDVMERCVQENLMQCEKWSRTFLQELLAANTAAADIRELNDHMVDYLTQCFRQKNSSLSSGLFERGRPTDQHINVLRKMNYELTRHLKLEGTILLDRLYECDMMSESEIKSILAETTEKRKNEAFIDYLCSNFTTEKFKASILPILSEEQVHADLAERIIAELDSSLTNSDTIICTFCKMKAFVNPRKLSEVLFEQGSISPSVKHDLCLSTQPNSSKWELLLKNVQKEKKLLDALEKSYGHLFTEFQETGHPVLRCCCFDMKPGFADMSDFNSEVFSVRSLLQQSCTQDLLQDDFGWTHDHNDPVRCALDAAAYVDSMNTLRPLTGNVSCMQNEVTQSCLGFGVDIASAEFQIKEIRENINKYKADSARLELEYSVIEHILSNEQNMVDDHEMEVKMERISSTVTERKQFIKHAVNCQKAIEEHMDRLECKQQMVDFSKVKVDRKLRSMLRRINRAFLEKKTKMELACDMIWGRGGRRHD